MDLFLRDHDNNVYLIDLKTAKPNRTEFIAYKRTLLEWMAAFLHKEPTTYVRVIIAMPYNPYYPNDYNRWTGKNMLDRQEQLLVGKEFWNFLAVGDVHESLLACFQQIGEEMRDEIDGYFEELLASTA